MKKTIFCFGVSCLVLILISACTSTTTTPHFYTNNENTKLEILGEIIYESPDHPGYIALLRAARTFYPDCDYVIDIMIERRNTTTRFFWYESTSTTWIIRGTAVKYSM